MEPRSRFVLPGVILAAVAFSVPAPAQSQTAGPGLTSTTVVSGREFTWDMAFLPDGTMFFTEKCRGLSVRLPSGTINPLLGMKDARGYPDTAADLFCSGQAGMSGVAVDPDGRLPVDFNRRADMSARVPRAREQLAVLERLGLWQAPRLVERLLAEAERLPPPAAEAVVHGDLHFRHVLVEDGAVTGVIDWGDVCRADPAVDLQLVWSFLPPGAREPFLRAYGAASDEQLLRARVLALSLCAALAAYGHHESLPQVEHEALAGLRRTAC